MGVDGSGRSIMEKCVEHRLKVGGAYTWREGGRERKQ